MRIKNREEIKRILLISLSNIGDIILTLPVLSALKTEFSKARIDVMAGPNGMEIFRNHPFTAAFLEYDKFARLQEKQALIRDLRKNRYDLIVDLRNSLLPFLIGSRYRSPAVPSHSRRPAHKKLQHLKKLKALGLDCDNAPFCFYIDDKDREFVSGLLNGLDIKSPFVVVSPGAKSHIKRWTKEGFATACDRIIAELGMGVLMVGDAQDRKIIAQIMPLMKGRAVDLSGRLDLRQLGALIEKANLLITNDSAPMHIGSSLGAKVLAIFGPTDPEKYGPTHNGSVIIRREMPCAPCEMAQCRENYECMKLITADEVFNAVKGLL